MAVADPVPVEEKAAARRRGEEERVGAGGGWGRERKWEERAEDEDGHGRQTHRKRRVRPPVTLASNLRTGVLNIVKKNN